MLEVTLVEAMEVEVAADIGAPTTQLLFATVPGGS